MTFVSYSEKTPSRRLARTVVAGSIAALALLTSGCGLLSPIVEAPDTQSQLKKLELSVVKLENTQSESFNKLQYSVTELQNQLEATRKADAERAQNLESIQAQLESLRKDLANPRTGAAAAPVSQPDTTVEQTRILDRAAAMAGDLKTIPEAINLYCGFLMDYKDSPQVPNVTYELGRCYYAIKDYPKAFDTFQSVVTTYPQNPIVGNNILSIALCQFYMKKYAEARETVKDLLTRFPKFANDDTLKGLQAELAKVK